MDIPRLISIGALIASIATCVFVFLMYKRVNTRLDGLTQAHLGLSRTMQNFVSASLHNQNIQSGEVVETSDFPYSSEQQLTTINVSDEDNRLINRNIQRIPVSDDSDDSEDDSKDDSEDDSEGDISDNDSEGDSDIEDNNDINEPTIIKVEDELVRKIEIDESWNNENTSQPLEIVDDLNTNSSEGSLSEDISGLDIIDSEQDDNDNENVSDGENQIRYNSAEEKQDNAQNEEINTSSFELDLRQQKVESLRKMALEMNLVDEENVKRIKKHQLVAMLSENQINK